MCYFREWVGWAVYSLVTFFSPLSLLFSPVYTPCVTACGRRGVQEKEKATTKQQPSSIMSTVGLGFA